MVSYHVEQKGLKDKYIRKVIRGKPMPSEIEIGIF